MVESLATVMQSANTVNQRRTRVARFHISGFTPRSQSRTGPLTESQVANLTRKRVVKPTDIVLVDNAMPHTQLNSQWLKQEVTVQLSKIERIQLINQHRILQKLYPEEAKYNEKAIEILSNGYEYLYDEIYQFIYDGDDVMSDAECKEVWDTLSMFDSIDRTIEELGLEHDTRIFTKFMGYDGNNEGKFLGFAEFTIMKDRRFTSLPLNKENYFNSHMPVREIYGRMLDAWQSIDPYSRYPMTKENLDKVLEAANYPNEQAE